ncbi:MAG: hypothetical protein JWN80_1203 [Microbacteriaceae bacterium]|nr:hypothetical protein [Microbacteriaceae bacterium]
MSTTAVRAALIGVALVSTLALAGCAHETTPTSASSESTTPPVTVSATPDPLANLDSTLAAADGAENQSQSDLSSGDASAAKNDDQ